MGRRWEVEERHIGRRWACRREKLQKEVGMWKRKTKAGD